LPTTSTSHAKGEPLFDPPCDVRPVSAVRGTLLVLDRRWLHDHGLLEKYADALGGAHGIFDAAPADWVPFPEGMAHWRALDALSLPPEEAHDMGRCMGERVHNVVLATLVRLAGQLGVSPWAALGQCDKLWKRSWRGGGMAAYRTGSCSARVEILNAEVTQSSNFRSGVCGTVCAGIAPFCHRPAATEIREARTTSSMALKVTWQH
jgi:hypothetical protein